jgi:hypothetical protein
MIGRSLIWLSSNWKFFTFGFLSIYPIFLLLFIGGTGYFILGLGLFVLVLAIFAFANWSFLGVNTHEDKPLAAFSYGLIVNSSVVAIASIFLESGEGYVIFAILSMVGWFSLLLSQNSAR